MLETKSSHKQVELSGIVSVCKDLIDDTAGGVDQTVYEHVKYGGLDQVGTINGSMDHRSCLNLLFLGL